MITRLSAPISLHLPFLTASTNLSQYCYLALPGTVSKLGFPATGEELGYDREADIPKDSKSRGGQHDFIVSLVSYMKRFNQSWIELPKPVSKGVKPLNAQLH